MRIATNWCLSCTSQFSLKSTISVLHSKRLSHQNYYQFGRIIKKSDFLQQHELALQKMDKKNLLTSEQLRQKSNDNALALTQEQDSDTDDLPEDTFQRQLEPVEPAQEHFDKKKIRFIRSKLLYKGDDPYYEKVVTRPQRGVVWGLGGELIKFKQTFFSKGRWPEIEEVIAYLELEQTKDIVMIDVLEELKRTDLQHFIIMATTFSNKHSYKVAQSLLRALQSTGMKQNGIDLRIYGKYDDDWMMLEFNNIAVHLFGEESREEIDLEYRLRNPPSKETEEEYEKLIISQSGKNRGMFEPLVQ